MIETYTLGWILTQQGRYEEAEICISDALNVARRIDDVIWYCKVLQAQSQILRRRNAIDQAEQCCQQALQLLDNKLSSQPTYVHIRSDIEYELGRIARDRGNWNAAESHFLAARAVLEQDDNNSSSNPDRAWSVLSNLGFVAHQLGNLDTAAQMYRQSLDFCREIGGKGSMTTLLVRMATLEAQRGNRVAALDYAYEAMEWSRRLGMQHEQAEAEALLARLGVGPLRR